MVDTRTSLQLPTPCHHLMAQGAFKPQCRRKAVTESGGVQYAMGFPSVVSGVVSLKWGEADREPREIGASRCI